MFTDLENQLKELSSSFPGAAIIITNYEGKISYKVSYKGSEDVNFETILETIKYLEVTKVD